MRLSIRASLDYRFTEPTDVLVQLEAAATEHQTIEHRALDVAPNIAPKHVAAQDGIGTRFWTRPEARLTIGYRATVRIERPPCACASLPRTPLAALSPEVVACLLPSRYCPLTSFDSFVKHEFGGLEGGAAALAMRDWIAHHFTYVPGASHADTTAIDSFVRRQGVCRDYAHVLIALARTAGIPARIASVYAPRVDPQDFHAVAQVYLDGAWHLLDATGMAHPHEVAIIGVGRDAADVSFLTAFGSAALLAQSVEVIATEE